MSKKDITKAGAKERRLGTDNINQKASKFEDKRTKRNRTKSDQKRNAIKDNLENS